MGKVDPEGIHASPEALEETKRLDKIFDDNVQKQNDLKESHWIISFLNVRSLKPHKADLEIDNVIMESDIFSLGETWLKPGETVNFDTQAEMDDFADFLNKSAPKDKDLGEDTSTENEIDDSLNESTQDQDKAETLNVPTYSKGIFTSFKPCNFSMYTQYVLQLWQRCLLIETAVLAPKY